MITPDSFDQLWHQFDGYTVEPPEAVEEDPRCVYAQDFAAWVKEYCQDALKQPDLITINQTMLLLLKKYFEWRACVPKAHRDRIGERGHICIFHVFERTYQQLKVAELSLKPPMLFLPAATAQPVIRLPDKLEQALEGYTMDQILGQGE